MAQFTFNLEGVLRHRKNVEHEKQRDFSIVQAKMTELENKLRALDADVQTSNDTMRQDHLTGSIDPLLLAAHRRYLGAAQRTAVEIAQQMAAIQRQLDAARQALADAARERKVLEKLKENKQTEWDAELKRKQAAEQDEIAMQISFRKTLK